jgi:hypothetical protein
MDTFATLNPAERRVFFEEAALPLNMQAVIVEKDFWVCWTLKELFALPAMGDRGRPQTSASKPCKG